MKKNINGYLLIMLVGLLAACKVSKDVRLPENSLPGSYRSATASTDTNSVGRLPWKSFFTETTLQNLIDSAIARNNDLQLAIKNIEAARLTLQQAKWGNVPAVGLQATATINRPSNNSLNGISLSQFLGSKHIEDYTVAANISWEADIWGKISSRKAQALAAYLQTGEARKAVQTQLVASVSQAYFNLLMLDEQLGVAKRNVMLTDSTLRIIRLQFNAGQVTLLAVQQAEAQRLTAARLIPQFEQDITIQENALSILSGKLPDSIVRSGRLNDVALPQTLSTGLPSQLLSLRPDVKSAELDIERANAVVGYTKASMYPSLTITAQGGVNAFKASNWFNVPASLFGIATGGIAQPLLQRRELKTNYEIAKVNREKSVIQFRQQVLQAAGEVSDALVRIDKLSQQQNIAADRTKTLEQATRNANMLFKNGMANYLEVITAQSNVLQSELELASIKKAQLDATVDLYRSLGGGWN
ncbi:efflux transporter outer membrane subunit [Mucilaginibacter sp. Bleaf8]|uniref:TolC family protein n=1 Tax=Mucilaginibacter sp. Bleaf8 TaxID=2834430 RepID=UPI001BCE6AF7|nr:efflux transporter outer membrane subunit [Mucilaginibacter sp. Bleaf8]MBS7566926.1 efflux transporter outer membrane subunit [Mucilaginibacter sp. Bleaf8]